MKHLLAVLLCLAITLGNQLPLAAQGGYLEPREDRSLHRYRTTMLRGKIEEGVELQRQGRLEADLTVKERTLLIAWDKWREKFGRAIWVKFNSKLAGGYFIPIGTRGISIGPGGHGFKNGTKATWSCEITNNRRVRNVRLVSSSGNRKFDELVLSCVRDMDRKRICAFPKGSARTFVTESGTDSIGNGVFDWSDSNDVERRTVVMTED